jgi:hypothetical protein
MTRHFVATLEDFVARHGIPLVQLCPGQRKDDVMAEHLRRFAHAEGVVPHPFSSADRKAGYRYAISNTAQLIGLMPDVILAATTINLTVIRRWRRRGTGNDGCIHASRPWCVFQSPL